MAPAWKAGVPLPVPRVRIPNSPPDGSVAEWFKAAVLKTAVG
jgi:hypothetical protein